MIRRVVEYIITCDAERFNMECFIGAVAFNARENEECQQGARRDGWQQVSRFLWLCPRCAANLEIREREIRNAGIDENLGLKRCSTCKLRKPPDEFGKNRSMKDGLSAECRECIKTRSRERTFPRLKLSERYKKQHAANQRAYARRNKHIVAAYQAVAPKREALRKAACESCGASDRPLHLHHPDYSKPLEVVTLCVPCHESEHHRRKIS